MSTVKQAIEKNKMFDVQVGSYETTITQIIPHRSDNQNFVRGLGYDSQWHVLSVNQNVNKVYDVDLEYKPETM